MASRVMRVLVETQWWSWREVRKFWISRCQKLVVFVVGVLGGGGGELLNCDDLVLESLLTGLKDLSLGGAGVGCVVDAGKYGGDETGLFGEVVDMDAEVVADCGLFVNSRLE